MESEVKVGEKEVVRRNISSLLHKELCVLIPVLVKQGDVTRDQ